MMGMTTAYYPTITSGPIMGLTTIKQQLDLDEKYLDSPECPYDEQTRIDLKKLLEPRIVVEEKVVEKIVERKVEVMVQAAEGKGRRGPTDKPKNAEQAEVVGKELAETLTDLRALKLSSKTLQPKDKIDIMKVQASLLEKLITMQERNTNIKRMSLFMSTVMAVLDDLMTEDTRQAFMKRIQPFADQE